MVQGKPWTKTDTATFVRHHWSHQIRLLPRRQVRAVWLGLRFDVREDNAPIQGSNAFNHSLTYDMTVEMSLISTSNYKVVAAFSAQAEGSDNRLSLAA